MVDKVVAEIKGTARVIAGDDETFSGVRYRISVVDLQGRRSLLQGTIEAEPSVLSWRSVRRAHAKHLPEGVGIAAIRRLVSVLIAAAR